MVYLKLQGNYHSVSTGFDFSRFATTSSRAEAYNFVFCFSVLLVKKFRIFYTKYLRKVR